MEEFTSRSFDSKADLQAMMDLVKSRPAVRVTDFPSLVDLQEMLGLVEIQSHTRLWEDLSGKLAGFALLDGTCLIFEIMPGCPSVDLGQGMIQWATARLRDEQGLQPGQERLETTCRDNDTIRRSLLEEAGFVLVAGGSLQMVRPLNEPAILTELPAGCIIRSLAGESEVAAWVRLHQAAWGTANMTEAYKLAMMQTTVYVPDLDLVAIASDGDLAAYCVVTVSEEENALTGCREGHLDPIATHPRFQHRGLAKVLMLTGMSLLKQRGMQTARLSTSQENHPMQCEARSVGFQTETIRVRYAKL